MLQRLRHAVGWPSSSPAQTRVDFQVSAKLGQGESLIVVGDAGPLGGSLDVHPNNTTQTGGPQTNVEGVVLVTTPELYPVWYNPEPVVLPAKSTVRYRYSVFSGGRFNRYENVETPRTLYVKGLEMSTQDTLDILSPPLSEEKRYSIPIVPRLSSGQAFVDRRAIPSLADNEGSVRRGQRRGAKRTPILLSPSTPSTIVEEDEALMSTSSTEKSKSSEQGDASLANDGMDKQFSALDKIGYRETQKLDLNDSQRSSQMVVKRRRSISDEVHQEVTIESTDGVIIVSYSLPVTVSKSSSGKWIVEWEEDNLLCPKRNFKGSDNQVPGRIDIESMRITWVGTVNSKDPVKREDEDELTRALAAYHCVPVFLKEELASVFYSYSHGTLWPVFHNVVDVYGELPTRWWNPTQQKVAWSMYTDANRIFVDKVIEVFNEGDLVWVHGVHLLLAPSFLARRLPLANVGLFLHTPFPSSEIFRTLSVRADILRGMLSADHIGFHLFEYARHFLTSVRRILGLKYCSQPGGFIGVEYNGRLVAVTISHIGIEPPMIDHVSRTGSVHEKIEELKQRYATSGKTIIVGVDEVQRLKGVPVKMLSIEDLLTTHPEWIGKIHVLQIGIQNHAQMNSSQSELYKRTHTEIVSIVHRINKKFQNEIVSYLEVENTSLSDRMPLWSIGDIMFLTSIREAVNLFPFEFVYAQEIMKKSGVLILSEFSGSSRVLTGCLGINPWKREEVIAALDAALSMPQEEKQARHEKDLQYILDNTRTQWAERVLIDLKRSRKSSSDGEFMGYGLGLNFRMLEFNAGFKALEVDQVARSYRTSFRRVLLFDYGNTLVAEEYSDNKFSKYFTSEGMGEATLASKSPFPSPPNNVINVLRKLCMDPRNTVFVLSGKDKAGLEEILGDIPGLGLAAEHGYLYRWGSFHDKEQDWLCTKDNFDDSWKDLTHAVMDIYTQRTHGTYIELKGSSIIWQFRDGDPEFSQLQSKELHDQLTQVLEHFPVEVLMGGDYIEVRPEGVDKGAMVDRIISTIESTNDNYVDFILCIGDDSSDEFMFSYLEENRPLPKLFTCTVGKKPSAAKFFVNDVEGAMEVLSALTKVSTTSNRNFSMNDLHTFETNTRISSDTLIFDSSKKQMEGYFHLSNSLKSAKYSMSMNSLSTVADSLPPTSSTLEQYFSNLEEEDDHGGIFF